MNEQAALAELEDIEKAAIFLLAIGEEAAAEVLKKLGPNEVQSLGAAMAELKDVKRERIVSVMESFADKVDDTTGFAMSSDAYLRSTLNKALGEDKAANVVDRIVLGGNTRGLDALKWMEPRGIADVIRYEHPQIQTIVIAYLDGDLAAEVLSFLPEETRLDIVVRVAKLETVTPEALNELNEILEKQLSGKSSTQKRKIGGFKVAADIMTSLDTAVETEIMEGLSSIDEELTTQIQDLMFVFSNLNGVDDRGIQALLREVSTEVLVIALKGADEELKNKIFSNMSSRAADLLRDDLEAMGPTKLSDVENAQKEILTIARRMAEAGDIVLGGSGEQML